MCAEAGSRDWKIRVEDILLSITRIQSYTDELTLEQFQNDNLRIDAVIRNLEIIGEAASRIPVDIQEKYPDIAWFEMRGMRNIIIHDYFRVSIPIIWHTIRHDLMPLAEGLHRLLEEHTDD